MLHTNACSGIPNCASHVCTTFVCLHQNLSHQAFQHRLMHMQGAPRTRLLPQLLVLNPLTRQCLILINLKLVHQVLHYVSQCLLASRLQPKLPSQVCCSHSQCAVVSATSLIMSACPALSHLSSSLCCMQNILVSCRAGMSALLTASVYYMPIRRWTDGSKSDAGCCTSSAQ